MATDLHHRASVGWVRFGGPILLLTTPFVIFLRHHAYSVSEPAALVCLAVLTAAGALIGVAVGRNRAMAATMLAGLVTAFGDIQFAINAPVLGVGRSRALALLFVAAWIAVFRFRRPVEQLLVSMSAVVLLSTFLLPGGRVARREEQPGARHADLPFVLHVVLDSQIGIDGIPATRTGDLRREWLTWLASRDFRVLTGAYSEWSETRHALAHALNFTSRQQNDDLLEPGNPPFAWTLPKAAYFEGLRSRGYRLHVYQTEHVDLCGAARADICHTYGNAQLGVLQNQRMPVLDKARVIAASYSGRSGALRWLQRQFARLRTNGVSAPAWSWERMRVGPIATSVALDRLADDLKTAARGQFVFAHLLLPHYPYLYDAGCAIRPVTEWLDPAAPHLVDVRNTPTTRALRYARYADHSRCAMRQVTRLLDSIPEEVRSDAVVVLHGDHGPKISLHSPSADERSALVASDYVDTYSVLFAVRSRGLPAGRDATQVPLGCTLAALYGGGFQSLAVAERCAGPVSVPLRLDGGRYVDQPLPVFDVSDRSQ